MTAAFELGSDGPSLILVGIDGSRTSMRAGSYAAGLARRQGSPLACVHVQRLGPGAYDASLAAARKATEQEVSLDLEVQMVQRATEIGIDARFYAVEGDPFTEISRLATELRADAVVVGASEAAGHRLVGSLASRLVKAGKWPVTVVP